MCIAEVLGMLGIFMFSALLPELQAEWSLSNSAAGWITGIYFFGFLVAVPVLATAGTLLRGTQRQPTQAAAAAVVAVAALPAVPAAAVG